MTNFIGYTRYSLWKPGASSWKASNGQFYKSEEEYRDYLYSDARLNLRASIFVGLSLPQLAAASKKHNLFHVVSYSDSLPEKHQDILEQAAEEYPFLLLDRQTSTALDIGLLAKEKFGGRSVFGQYRLDDDDVLSVDFFDRVSRYVAPPFVGMQVSLASGYTGILSAGKLSKLSHLYSPMIALGLLGVNEVREDGSINGPSWVRHTQSDRSNPVILDSREPVYFRALHASNDRSVNGIPDQSIAQAQNELSRLRQVNDDELEGFTSSFPSMAGALPRYTRSEVFTRSSQLDDEILIELDAPKSRFRFSAKLFYGDHDAKVVTLFRFNLVDAQGAPVSTSQPFEAYGLSRSSDKSAGFFKYINSRPGQVTVSGEIELPLGIACESLSLVRWGSKSQGVPVTLQEVVLSS